MASNLEQFIGLREIVGEEGELINACSQSEKNLRKNNNMKTYIINLQWIILLKMMNLFH